MIHQNKKLALLTVGLLALSAADMTAQTRSMTRSYSRSMGNSYLGLTGYAYGNLRSYVADVSNTVYTGGTMTLSSASARGYLRATAKILNSTRELGRFDARGDVVARTSGVTTNGSVRLLLAGKTMVSRSFTTTTTLPNFSRYISLFPVDPRADIPVGPLTVTVKGNAGVGIEAYGRGYLSTSTSVGVSYTAKAWGRGRASVGVGIPGFSLGVEADAILAEQKLVASLWANTARITGRVTYSIQALRLKLKAFAEAFWVKYSKTLLSSSWGSYTRTLFSI